MRIGILSFPGSNCDLDVLHVVRDILGIEAQLVWHHREELNDYDALILPGGFSFGDHLRAGVIAARSPAMKGVKKLAQEGRPILGICNGFQILVEAGLLPGALLRNSSLRFVCRWVRLKVASTRSVITRYLTTGSLIKMPIAHNEGRFFLPERELQALKEKGRIILQYADEKGRVTERANPNGSSFNIAGICNEEGNVVGLMPHPERASDPLLSPFGSADGLLLLKALVRESDS